MDRLRARLAGEHGRRYWRSLDDLARTAGFREILDREFPGHASEWADDAGRRNFLKLMGASLALAGITACTRQPKETIAPYAQAPEGLVPGRPAFYATALTLGGFARGAIVETHEGRPTKVEGHPDHPASLGAADVFMQAAVLGLYDPDRSRTVTYLGEIHPWGDYLKFVEGLLDAQKESGGAGLRILTEAVTSPTLADQIERTLARFPAARWHRYEPAGRDAVYEGARIAIGEPLDVVYRIADADVILSLDADFLAPGPSGLRYIREFAARRRAAPDGMNRLYVIESATTNTGAAADHRIALPARDVEEAARALATALGVEVPGADRPTPRIESHRAWIEAASRDLRARGPRAVVIPGDHQPPIVHAIALAINASLGSLGGVALCVDPAEAGLDAREGAARAGSLRELADDMAAGEVSLLMILGGNPAYTAPADLRFAERLEKVAMRIHLGPYQDETAALCQWHIPQAHELESWSDARAHDGTASIIQPMIEPLYGGRTAHEVLAPWLEQAARSGYETVRDFWARRGLHEGAGVDFERWWRRALHDGLVAGSASAARPVALRGGWIAAPPAGGGERGDAGLEIVFRPDPAVHDGRFANNGWLQELPRPVTRLTWDNAALMAARTADRLGLSSGDEVDLMRDGRTVRAPVWIVPGHPDDSVTVHLGYGRVRTGRVGEGAGFDACALLASGWPSFGGGLEVRPTGRRVALACTQDHQSMQGRHHVRFASVEEYREHPDFAHHLVHEPAQDLSLYPKHEYPGHAWGMVIDLNSCVGCNACVVGCQSENNIPVVGRDQVAVGREMHWIRVDRYFEGDVEEPTIWNQPVPCMHCEDAPCEPVCPVGATVHSSEGLNDMVYNRCVGTRYCSNNCPYKVRRFNFLLYSDFETPSLKLLQNPDVTVRSRGVMEKCTYCVQRINAARIRAHNEDREIRDGEIVTACQQACPAQAITFGDINDPGSRVSQLKADPRNYGMLADLNTRPRTTYLAALKNPNPELEPA